MYFFSLKVYPPTFMSFFIMMILEDFCILGGQVRLIPPWHCHCNFQRKGQKWWEKYDSYTIHNSEILYSTINYTSNCKMSFKDTVNINFSSFVILRIAKQKILNAHYKHGVTKIGNIIVLNHNFAIKGAFIYQRT